MAKYDVVLFNLDNTLIKTTAAAKNAYKQAIYYLAKNHGLHDSRDKLHNHWKRIVNKLLGEKKPILRRFAYSLDLLLKEHNLPTTFYPQALKTYERELLKNLDSVNGVKELFEKLKKSKVRIAVLTGSDRAEAEKKLKTTKLDKYIDLLVTSSDTQVMKPDSSFFQKVFESFKTPKEKMLMVSDSKVEDLKLAATLGLDTHHLKGEQNLLTLLQLVI